MPQKPPIDDLLARLNPEQRRAATHGRGPLLIVAGAGTGKTATLVHRVAWLIANGVDPARILLLTFTRRAAAEMSRRVEAALRQLAREEGGGEKGGGEKGEGRGEKGEGRGEKGEGRGEKGEGRGEKGEGRGEKGESPFSLLPSPFDARQTPRYAARLWGGTFHAIATRLLRRWGKAIGLPPQFTIHDRGDSEDLINVLRTELELAKTDQRFPKKGTCMAIYSRCVNARQKLEDVLRDQFPWCQMWTKELTILFDAYVDRKESAGILDYDDLLIYWQALLDDPKAGPAVRGLFDCVLVDEYQDTNALQAEILYGLTPEGQGLTVVGDDAQSIYAFRAATVRNILDFPKHYPGTTIVTLEQNYRSTSPILEATNLVIAEARERYKKDLWSQRTDGPRPQLVNCQDEDDQTMFVIRHILEHREAGVDLRRQAVLFRASHHSILLEAELTGRNIPFHKFGGLKFVETAHVKDLMAFLRLAENPRDVVSGLRILPLLPGVGPGKARQAMDVLLAANGDFAAWRNWKAPAAVAGVWPKLVGLMEGLVHSKEDLTSQVHRVRVFYAPLLEAQYDHVQPRLRDLEQLEMLAGRYRSRRRMLEAITLDPPNSTQDLAGPPKLDDDYLVLSTIHSAKGLEWDAVYVIHASDGNIPSDMATKNPEEIEEERRLFYVALTRAKTYLYVCCPFRYYHFRPGVSDQHGYAQRSRFLGEAVVRSFDQQTTHHLDAETDGEESLDTRLTSRSVRRRTKNLWR